MNQINLFFYKLLILSGTHKRTIIRLVDLGSYLFAGFLILGSILIKDQIGLPILIPLALRFGQIAVVLFVLSTIPGILGRFKLRHALTSIGMSYRRYTGRLSFIFAFGHALFLFIIPAMFSQAPFMLPDFMVFGLISLFLLFILFITSNDFGVKTLGRFWKPLHRLVYVIYWLIFLHVILQGSTKTGALIFLIATLEILSLIYSSFKNRASSG